MAAGGLTILMAAFGLPRATAQALSTPSAPQLPPTRITTPPASASGVTKSSPAAPAPGATMAAASGGMVTINVTAGVGDPAAIGRTVVEAIRQYERTSGTSWRN